MSPQDVEQQLRGIAARDPRAEVIGPCRRAAMALRAGREGCQLAVLGELRELAVIETARPALQRVMAWAQGQLPHMNRAL